MVVVVNRLDKEDVLELIMVELLVLSLLCEERCGTECNL